jgi:hypothetical protein
VSLLHQPRGATDRRMVTTNATTCWSDTSAPHSPARSSARRPLPATKRSQVPATLRALNNPRSARFVDNGDRSKLQRTFCSTAAHISRPDGPPHAGSRVRMALSPRSWHLIRSSLPWVPARPPHSVFVPVRAGFGFALILLVMADPAPSGAVRQNGGQKRHLLP